ncbi:hypothetical protein V474_15780 [Novosphingobium barchaimii LL02]|uniref:Alginate export domain-containing protein n=1 Tax=Novosphingobium barchaimii LL02 TaxID=1114963 RepID=A0A0J7XYQ5_9SPHN|nr:hypothetical protein V474_15780 [Novosphingobium barchaimii LL02]
MAFALVLPGLAASPAEARTEPKLEVDTAIFASSNPLLLSTGKAGAVMVEVAASPSVTITTQNGSTLLIAGTLRRRDYSRLYGHFLLGDARVEGRYRHNEYLNIGFAAGFERMLALDLLTSSPDGASDPGAIRNNWFSGVDAAWTPNAYELITPEVRVERTYYTGSNLLLDAKALSMGVGYSRRTGPRTSIGLRVHNSISSVAAMGNVNTAALYATFNRKLPDHVKVLVEFGASRTGEQKEISSGFAATRPGRTLLAGRLELCREDGEWARRGPTGCFSTSLDTEVSGLGGLRRNAIVSLSVMQPVGAKFVLRGSGEFRHSTLVGGAPAIGPPDTFGDGATDALRAMGALDWKLHPQIMLTGNVQYARRQAVTGDRIGAAYFGIQLTFKPRTRR